MSVKASAAPSTKPNEDADKEKQLDDLEAELKDAVGRTPASENIEREVHPFLTAQAFAMERRDAKQAYVRLVIAARVRRKTKDHGEAQRLFQEAIKARDTIITVDAMVRKESEVIQGHYHTILKDWEADLDEELEKRAKQREARTLS